MAQEITYELDPDYILAKIPRKWFNFESSLIEAKIEKQTKMYVYLNFPKPVYMSHVDVMSVIYKKFVNDDKVTKSRVKEMSKLIRKD
jgi:hypothetical protein